jgi:hypothetical protein
VPLQRTKIERLFEGPAFEPEATRLLGQAYDLACRGLHDKGQPDIIREMIAERIISLAVKGQRDPQKLSEAALKSLGIDPQK